MSEARLFFIATGNEGKLREFRDAFARTETLRGARVVGIKELEGLGARPYVEPVEDADLFLLNAAKKLINAEKYLKDNSSVAAGLQPIPPAAPPATPPVWRIIVDDSGLCVPELSFLPGVHSATFGGTPRSDERNRRALAERLRGKSDGSAEVRMDAFFVCFLMSMACELDDCPTPGGDVPGLLAALEEKERELDSRVATERRVSESFSLSFSGARKASVDVHVGRCFGQVSTVEQQLLVGEGHGYDAMFYEESRPALSFASVPLADKNLVSHRGRALKEFLGT